MLQRNFKAKAMLAVKISLTAVLLYYVASLVDLKEITPLFTQLDITFFLFALTAHTVAFFLMSIRWWLIMNSSGTHIQYKQLCAAYYLGLFCNNFLPTAMGGDVIRILKLRSQGLDTNQLVFATLCDRVIGLLSIILMGMIGLNLSTSVRESIGHNSIYFINVTSVVFLILSTAMLHPHLRKIIFYFFVEKLRFWSRFNNFLRYSHKNLESLAGSKIIPKAILLSLMSQLLVVITYYCIARSLHIDLALLEFALIVPVVAVFTSLPVSVGGMGVREGTMIFLLGTVGIHTTNAVSISLLYLAILILLTLPGGTFLLFGKRSIKHNCVTCD